MEKVFLDKRVLQALPPPGGELISFCLEKVFLDKRVLQALPPPGGGAYFIFLGKGFFLTKSFLNEIIFFSASSAEKEGEVTPWAN